MCGSGLPGTEYPATCGATKQVAVCLMVLVKQRGLESTWVGEQASGRFRV
jgi:hypothetical protein